MNEPNQPETGRYRHIVEKDILVMEGLSSRISSLEKQTSAMSIENKSLFGAINRIENNIDRLAALMDASFERISNRTEKVADQTRPNMDAMFKTVIAVCSVLLMIIGLALVPVYRGFDSISQKTTALSIQNKEEHKDITTRFYRNEEREYQNAMKTARLEGIIEVYHREP